MVGHDGKITMSLGTAFKGVQELGFFNWGYFHDQAIVDASKDNGVGDSYSRRTLLHWNDTHEGL